MIIYFFLGCVGSGSNEGAMSLSFSRRRSFYSGALSRNFEKGKQQLRASQFRATTGRRSSFPTTSSTNSSFIFSEILQSNSMDSEKKMEAREKNSGRSPQCMRLNFGLDETEEQLFPTSCKTFLGSCEKPSPSRKCVSDSPLRRARRSLSLLTPNKLPSGEISTPLKSTAGKLGCDSESKDNFSGFGSHERNRKKGEKCLDKQNVSDYFTPSKKVQFSFEDTPSKAMQFRGSDPPKSILKTPNKSPQQTPRKMESITKLLTPRKSIIDTPTKVFASKRSLVLDASGKQLTPRKHSLASRKPFSTEKPIKDSFKKLLTPKKLDLVATKNEKLSLGSFSRNKPEGINLEVTPTQKENKFPSKLVTQFADSTPKQFDLLLHSPITSSLKKKKPLKESPLAAGASSSECFFQDKNPPRKLLSPFNSTLKTCKPSPSKEVNWDFKPLVGSPVKFLLNSSAEFEITSPSKRNLRFAKTDLLMHEDTVDESVFRHIGQTISEKDKKAITEVPLDQVEPSSGLKEGAENDKNYQDFEEIKMQIEDNVRENETTLEIRADSAWIDKVIFPLGVSQPIENDPVSTPESLEPKVAMKLQSAPHTDADETKIENVSRFSYQKREPLSASRKITQRDSDSGISLGIQSEEHSVDLISNLEENINKVLSLLASPFKAPTEDSKSLKPCAVEEINDVDPQPTAPINIFSSEEENVFSGYFKKDSTSFSSSIEILPSGSYVEDERGKIDDDPAQYNTNARSIVIEACDSLTENNVHNSSADVDFVSDFQDKNDVDKVDFDTNFELNGEDSSMVPSSYTEDNDIMPNSLPDLNSFAFLDTDQEEFCFDKETLSTESDTSCLHEASNGRCGIREENCGTDMIGKTSPIAEIKCVDSQTGKDVILEANSSEVLDSAQVTKQTSEGAFTKEKEDESSLEFDDDNWYQNVTAMSENESSISGLNQSEDMGLSCTNCSPEIPLNFNFENQVKNSKESRKTLTSTKRKLDFYVEDETLSDDNVKSLAKKTKVDKVENFFFDNLSRSFEGFPGKQEENRTKGFLSSEDDKTKNLFDNEDKLTEEDLGNDTLDENDQSSSYVSLFYKLSSPQAHSIPIQNISNECSSLVEGGLDILKAIRGYGDATECQQLKGISLADDSSKDPSTASRIHFSSDSQMTLPIMGTEVKLNAGGGDSEDDIIDVESCFENDGNTHLLTNPVSNKHTTEIMHDCFSSNISNSGINSPVSLDGVTSGVTYTPRRSNRSRKQTDKFQSPMDSLSCSPSNYILHSPLLSSRKKRNSYKNSKVQTPNTATNKCKITRQLYPNEQQSQGDVEHEKSKDIIKEFDDTLGNLETQDDNCKDRLSAENDCSNHITFSSTGKFAAISPIKGRLSDSFEIISPHKPSIHAIKKEDDPLTDSEVSNNVPEGLSKSPIILRIRRKKKKRGEDSVCSQPNLVQVNEMLPSNAKMSIDQFDQL